MDFPAVGSQRDIAILRAAGNDATAKSAVPGYVCHVFEGDVFPFHGNIRRVQLTQVHYIAHNIATGQRVRAAGRESRKLIGRQAACGNIQVPHVHLGTVAKQNAVRVHEINIPAARQGAVNIGAGVAGNVVQVIFGIKTDRLPVGAACNRKVHPFDYIVGCPAGDVHGHGVGLCDVHRRILGIQYRQCVRRCCHPQRTGRNNGCRHASVQQCYGRRSFQLRNRRCGFLTVQRALPISFCNFTHHHVAVPHFAPDDFVNFVHGAPPYRFPAARHVLPWGSAIYRERLL